MRIAILTSDILDGLIISQKIVKKGRDVAVIIYETKKRTWKPFLKRVLCRLRGMIRHITYEGIAKEKPKILVEAVADINSARVKELLTRSAPDLGIVIGTRKLSKDVFGIPRFGSINMHSGVLPYYRGADSEFWALYNGDIDKIGVSVHFIDEKLDAGDIIVEGRQKVSSRDEHKALRMKNMFLGAEKIDEAIGIIEKGRLSGTKQDEALSATYRSASGEDIADYRVIKKELGRHASCVSKEFGPDGLKVFERVARKPLVTRITAGNAWPEGTFSLRIDADEYERKSFGAYYPLFEKYRGAVTVFFNAYSFRSAGEEILKCRDMGIDIASHGYYHYTYNDYASNRYNIGKAKEFFAALGINTGGFAAPMGKWNEALMRALEDEGYEYSSDFAYDYNGFPGYPLLKDRWSAVLEVPVFPVSPELFFEKGYSDTAGIIRYYKEVIDWMHGNLLPVIIYAHTSPAFKEVPALLDAILEYAIKDKGLKPVSMAGFVDLWRTRKPGGMAEKKEVMTTPHEFMGRIVDPGCFRRLKNTVKGLVDFETVTPPEELRCGMARKMVKLTARKIFQGQGL